MKKYNIFRNIALGALVVSSLSSCEDYLSLSNPNKTTVETFWTDLKDTKSGLYATYAALRNDYVLNIREEAWRSDLCWPGYGRPQPQNMKVGTGIVRIILTVLSQYPANGMLFISVSGVPIR